MERINIYSNFRAINKFTHNLKNVNYIPIIDCSFFSLLKLFKIISNKDVVILNIASQLLFKICLLRLLFPFKKFKLVSVDILLRKPQSIKDTILAVLKSILLKQVDLFILYFRNTVGYEKYYKIQSKKIIYVPFKVNDWQDDLDHYYSDTLGDSYVLCAGQTLRDIKTFIEAMKKIDVPAVLLTPNNDILELHGTKSVDFCFPENVKHVLHNDKNHKTFLDWIKKSSIVVIPRFSYDISSTGISTYLSAMGAWRCVILSKGPGAEDILEDGQVVFVNPEDPHQLASAIAKAWTDKDYRSKIAINGRKYAEQVQGEDRLITDILYIACPSVFYK